LVTACEKTMIEPSKAINPNDKLHHCVTVMRALGVPTRSVTNYNSAHDTDASTTIDYHMDEEGDMIDYMNSDSVWYVSPI